jgi:hypothetical protein
MGIFDALTNIFTGAPQVKAAEQQQAYLAQQQAAEAARVKAAQEQGIGALQAGQTGALGAIQGGVGTARGDIQSNVPQALQSLYAGAGAGAGALLGGQQGALGALQGGIQGAVGAFDPLAQAAGRYAGAGTTSTQATMDALGLNGPEGIARAQTTFQATPGYQFGLNQGLESIVRNANVGGGAFGGNALREAQTYGTGLANQEFDKYKAGLAGLSSLYSPLESAALGTVGAGRATPYLTGGTSAANIYTGTGGRLSDLYSGTGTNAANIFTGQGQQLANLAQTGGLAQGNVFTGTGGNIANLLSGLTGQEGQFNTALIPGALKSYSDAAAAQTGGSQNLWNFLGSGAKFAASGGFNPGSYSQLFS